MSRASVDPDELERFISALRRFNDSSRGELATVSRQFKRLGESWQDEEQARFAQSFEEMVRVMNAFLDESEREVPVLVRKAEAIRAYLERR
jgi:uncharacterized protein YukE